MSDELLPYYNRELSFLRKLAAQFAEDHPKIAERLRLGADEAQDPHVERLIQACSFLSARIRHKLDDDLPEITEALLGILYPHYPASIPSMSIVRMELDPERKDLAKGYLVPRHTPLETKPIQGDPCRFRTCYPVTLWPLEVESASLARPPLLAPKTPRSAGAAAVLRLVLHGQGKKIAIPGLPIDSLRFFLKGQPHHVNLLYELIFNHALEVALASKASDHEPVVLNPETCLRQVGFERDEGLLPYSPRSFVGYRLLTEYFAFPEKFLFVDLVGLKGQLPPQARDRVEVYIYLDRAAPDLEQHVTADVFQLGCTPLVNLYRQRAEPIQLTHTDYEYRVALDSRRPLAHEVYTIDRVTASSEDGKQTMEYFPFYSVKHASPVPRQAFFHATRRPAALVEGRTDHGTEVFLSLVDLNMRPSTAGEWTLDVETTCLNRDLPHRLPFGGDEPQLQVSEGSGLVARISCLEPFTRTLRPAQKHGALWRLISHLSLNHLSLVDNDEQADALREILKLYDFADSAETRALIAGVQSIKGRRMVGRLHGAVCRGVEATILFDDTRFSAHELFLFASVLERFLALYCTMNSFTRLIALTRGGEGELKQWPPRTGERVLI